MLTSVNDDLRWWLEERGYNKLAVQDSLYEYLGDQGYTQLSIQDRMAAWKEGILTPKSIPEGLYLHKNKVTVYADPEASTGWYQFDVGDGLEWFYVVADRLALKSITDNYNISEGTYGDEAELSITASGETHLLKCNNIVITKVTSLSEVFWDKTLFNQKISRWDLQNVTRMSRTFRNTTFNKDISLWNVTSVTTLFDAFKFSKFNQDIGGWRFSNLLEIGGSFYESKFNKPIGKWDVSKVIPTSMNSTFFNSPFAQDISSWCVSQISSTPPQFMTASPLNSLPDFKPKWGEPCITCSDGSKHHEDYTCP